MADLPLERLRLLGHSETHWGLIFKLIEVCTPRLVKETAGIPTPSL